MTTMTLNRVPHDTRPGIVFEWGNIGFMNITQDLSGPCNLAKKGIQFAAVVDGKEYFNG
jgi:hypothetical protein